VLQLTAEDLSSNLISAIRANQLGDFRQRLHNCTALLIDDIHRLAGRKASQEEFITTLEPLEDAGALVLVTSRSSPDQQQGLEQSMRTRLNAGTPLELRLPEWETRVAIVLERISQWEVEAHPDVAELIVSKLGDDMSRLDALITRLLTHPLCAGQLNEVPVVRRILSHGVRLTTQLAPEAVLGVVTRHFNLRLSDLRAPSRSPRVTAPRQIAMYLVRRHCGLSYPEIAHRFKRHHTTALHACRRMEQQRDENASLHATLSLLEKELRHVAESGG
jgi:chromosomal replication initiator protein